MISRSGRPNGSAFGAHHGHLAGPATIRYGDPEGWDSVEGRVMALVMSIVLSAASGAAAASVPAWRTCPVPAPAPVVRRYAPIGRFAGHWGVDLAAPAGSAVTAPVAGRVTFAGSVAGRRTVTIRTADGRLVSLSYLGALSVRRGAYLGPGDALGRSGRAHGRESVHVSVRVGGRYVDPGAITPCGGGARRIWLIPWPWL